MNQYYFASEAVACSFEEKDAAKIHDAISELIEAQNK
jgi:YHS domain-containing protein